MFDFNNIRDTEDGQGYVFEKYRGGEKVSSVELHIGGLYKTIEETKKHKHSNRNCIILGFELDKLDNPIRANVRFRNDRYEEDFVELFDFKEIIDETNFQ